MRFELVLFNFIVVVKILRIGGSSGVLEWGLGDMKEKVPQRHREHGGRDMREDLNKWTGEVIGAAIEVHRILGPGFLEEIYQEALEIELDLRGIPYRSQYPVSIKYKNRDIGKGRLDFFVNNVLVVELKAVENLIPKHKAQVISYLKMTKQPLGLLINFNETLLKDGIQRIIYTP